MKILHVGKYYFPSHGGIETVLKNLAEGLAAAGEEVTVLCSSETRQGSDETINGVRVIRAPCLGTLFSQPLSPTLPRELHRLALSFDLIHVHSPNPAAESSTLLFSGNKPVVVSYHSDIVRQRLFLPVYAPILRKFLHRAARVVVATPALIEHSPFLGTMKDRCAVIPFGIEKPSKTGDDTLAAQSRELSLKYGRFALFVGRLVGYKGVPILIEAMKNVGASCLIIGTGPMREALEAMIRASGLEKRVHLLGYVDDDALRAYFRACEFLVLPSISRNEAFGLVQIEAMAQSKPTLATRLESGIAEVCEPGVTGLLAEPEDPLSLAAAMNELLANPSRCLEMGHAARLRFEKLFTREKMVESYRELYRRVIES